MLQATKATSGWLPVALAMWTICYGGNEFTPLLVMYRQQGHFDPVFTDLLMFAYAIGIMPAMVFGGPLSDRYGRKILMLGAPLLAIIGSLLIAAGATNEVLMFSGRFASGVSVGLAMAVGTTWVKELSSPPFDLKASSSAGALRAGMAATAGFGLGAGVAGLLAQFGPIPHILPYMLHVVLTLPFGMWLLVVPETRTNPHRAVQGSFWADLKCPVVFHPRYVTVCWMVGPWVFGAAGVAYAIMPGLAASYVSMPIAFAALLTVFSMATGFGIQRLGPKIIGPRPGTSVRGGVVALGFVIAGMGVATFVSGQMSIPGMWLISFLLGAGYGMCLIMGLTEVQTLARPNELAGATAFFYCLCYLGFFFPVILQKLSQLASWLTYPVMLGTGCGIAVLFLLVLVLFGPRHAVAEKPQPQG